MKLFNINTIETTTHSVPDGVLNGGVGTIGADWSTDPGGSVRFNLFFDILLIFSFNSLRSQAKRMPVAVRCTLISTFLSGDSLTRILYRRGCFHMELSATLTSLKRHTHKTNNVHCVFGFFKNKKSYQHVCKRGSFSLAKI